MDASAFWNVIGEYNAATMGVVRYMWDEPRISWERIVKDTMPSASEFVTSVE